MLPTAGEIYLSHIDYYFDDFHSLDLDNKSGMTM